MDYLYILKFLGVMTSMIFADICWTYYFIKVDERKAIGAGLWGSSILIFGAFTTVNYVDDHTLLVAAVLGSFLGTAGAVQMKKRKEEKKTKTE